ncbi:MULTISPECIES: acetylxylan esterase [Microbacterium]|uniref:Acetylxylan esterase n=1 Tax=Microbacterium wangchenii TaxID=2541726 RepID=A0ABX5SP92_9MICO|nr:MULTISPECIES: acetylxylan esterase [Microbacterium]MCK6066629.1 acetylxylan esterase [Microbacterium sp. EYE_512]QBR87963.1 acetylxylan esterase [Microbacterium wangchenii]TXK18247.1 acetylxylan esterase [Microbacterium wangchenii]
MPRFDLPLSELEQYRPEVAEPDDFDAFWGRTLAESRAAGGEVIVVRAATMLRTADVWDVTFPGFAGDPVKAWYLRPAGRAEPLPVVVEFLGYGGGRGLPVDRLAWSAAGYGHLVMDTRGQGSGWGSGGDTADPHGAGPATPGYLTRGIDDPIDHYYRRVFTDAVRAVDAARLLPGADPDRIAVTGGSQGGGIALAAAGLCTGLVGVMPDVPFLCHFERAVGLTDRDPYHEVVRYLAVHRGAEATVFRTLSYLDGVNFARRADAPALFSTALLDQTCPPSTVFAAYNAYTGPREIDVFPHNDHEGGQAYQLTRQVAWLAERLS